MSFWEKHADAPEFDMSDHNILIDALEEVDRLRNALTDRWVDTQRIVSFLDIDRDGKISHDEFYDGLSQFGLSAEIDINKVFAYLDKDREGCVKSETLIESLAPKDEDKDEEQEEEEEEELEEFGAPTPEEEPESLLVGLVAHNNLKPSMMRFVKSNIDFFKRVKIVTTGTTGRALGPLGITVDRLVSSGPLGGDQEIGGMVSTGEVAAVFFFIDPLSSHPHEADIVALNRICCVHDTMFANNPSTAQALVYALEYSGFGFSRLMGMNPTHQEDSAIVVDYKKKQMNVVKKMAGNRRSSIIRAPITAGSVARLVSPKSTESK